MLPAQTRYESGGTSTSTERRIRFSPAIDDPDGVRIAEARAEWEIPALIGRALKPKHPQLFAWQSPADVRAEMGAHDAALRRHRGARRRRAVRAVGRRAAGRRTASPTCPTAARASRRCRSRRRRSPDGQVHARHAARQAVQLDHLRAEGSDHRRERATSCCSHADDLARARPRRRRARRRCARRSARCEATARIGPCRPQHAAGLLARGQRAPAARATIRCRASPTTTPSSRSSAPLQVLELQLLRRHRALNPRPRQQRLRRRAHLRADGEPEVRAHSVNTGV